MNNPKRWQIILPPARETLIRAGVPEVEANALLIGFLLGMSWEAIPPPPCSDRQMADVLAVAILEWRAAIAPPPLNAGAPS